MRPIRPCSSKAPPQPVICSTADRRRVCGATLRLLSPPSEERQQRGFRLPPEHVVARMHAPETTSWRGASTPIERCAEGRRPRLCQCRLCGASGSSGIGRKEYSTTSRLTWSSATDERNARPPEAASNAGKRSISLEWMNARETPRGCRVCRWFGTTRLDQAPSTPSSDAAGLISGRRIIQKDITRPTIPAMSGTSSAT